MRAACKSGTVWAVAQQVHLGMLISLPVTSQILPVTLQLLPVTLQKMGHLLLHLCYVTMPAFPAKLDCTRIRCRSFTKCGTLPCLP
jgi:hypothetical protein